MMAEIAHGAGHADIGLVEDPACRPGHKRAGRHAAHGQRNVGGDDDVMRAATLGNVVVGRIKPAETMTISTIGSRDGLSPLLARRRLSARGVRPR